MRLSSVNLYTLLYTYIKYTFFFKPPPVYESEDTESTDEITLGEETPVNAQDFDIGPLPLSVSRAR